MKKVIYPIIAFCLILLVLVGLYTLFPRGENKGRVLSKVAVRQEGPKKTQVVSPEKQSAQYEEAITRFLAEINLPSVFPDNQREREKIASRLQIFHDNLLESSVPPAYQSLHLELAILSSKIGQSLLLNKPEEFIQSIIEMTELQKEFSWLSF